MRNALPIGISSIDSVLRPLGLSWGRVAFYTFHQGIADSADTTVEDYFGSGIDLTLAAAAAEWTTTPGFYQLDGTAAVGGAYVASAASLAPYAARFSLANGLVIFGMQVYAAAAPTGDPDVIELHEYDAGGTTHEIIACAHTNTAGQLSWRCRADDTTLYTRGTIAPHGLTSKIANTIAIFDARVDGDLSLTVVQAEAGAMTYTPLAATDLSPDSGGFGGFTGVRQTDHFVGIGGRRLLAGTWSINTTATAALRRLWVWNFGLSEPSIGATAFAERLLQCNLLPAPWMVAAIKEQV